MLAMKFGDNCWLKGLTGAPELNGRRVALFEWVDDTGRWKCRPIGWRHTETFLGVKPKNLSNEPPTEKTRDAARQERIQAELDAAQKLLPPGSNCIVMPPEWRDEGARSKMSDDKARQLLARNIAMAEAARAQAAADSDEEADAMFEDMERQSEEKMVADGWRELTYPAHKAAQEFIALFDVRDSVLYDTKTHDYMQAVFEAKHATRDVKLCGSQLASKGGLEHMRVSWYNYQKVLLLACRTAGWNDSKARDHWHLVKLDLDNGWEGIHGWMA